MPNSITIALNKFWGATLGVAYSSFTGKADPWTLQAQSDQATLDQLSAIKKTCSQYPSDFIGPLPLFCDPNYQASLAQDNAALQQKVAASSNPDQSKCAQYDFFCMFFNSPGFKKFIGNVWILTIVAVVIVAIVVGIKIRVLRKAFE